MNVETIGDTDITQFSFISMLCAFRDTACIVEDPGNAMPREDVEQILPTLRRFSERWPVGSKCESGRHIYHTY